MSRRERNPRRMVIEDLHTLRDWIKTVRSCWEIRSEVFDPHLPTQWSKGDWRPRRPDDYPENSPERWQQLIRYMEAIIRRAHDVIAFARVQERLAQKRRDRSALDQSEV